VGNANALSIMSPCARDFLAPKRHRRAIAKRPMQAPLIVKFHPSGDPKPRLEAICVAFEIDAIAVR
jgi:hypothetical protein